MNVTFWGTRGSVATPGPETIRYGGDTACVEVHGAAEDHRLVLDAGTGIRRLGTAIPLAVRQIDLLLSHLHLDHIVGLGFFAPLFRPDVTVTVWGPASTESLSDRLGRYLSPPLFPVRLRDLPCELELREAPELPLALGGFSVTASPVIHPDPAVGYRIEAAGRRLVYLPDHEPALSPSFPSDPLWTSGAAVAEGADLLIHDAQYTAAEYADRIGWGHSSVNDAVAFAELVGARALALFHHDPGHDDTAVDHLRAEAERLSETVRVTAATEGVSMDVS